MLPNTTLHKLANVAARLDCGIVTPANERVKKLAARPVTSPRLRGEVGSRALARGFRVRGNGASPNCGTLCNLQKAPYPDPLPAGGERENSAALIQLTPGFFTRSYAGMTGMSDAEFISTIPSQPQTRGSRGSIPSIEPWMPAFASMTKKLGSHTLTLTTRY